VLRRPLEFTQYLSIRYTERLAKAGTERSVGSVGDSYDNALAETVIGLYKTEVIRRRDPGATSTPSSMRRWSGWTGSTVVASSNRSATSRRSNSRRRTTAVRRTQPWGLDSSNPVSGEPGAVHVLNGRWVTWAVDGPGMLMRYGVACGLNTGAVTITATSEGKSGSAVIIVTGTSSPGCCEAGC
jgi:hypothetical protein